MRAVLVSVSLDPPYSMAMNLSLQGEKISLNDINIETQEAWISRFAGISALIIFAVNIPIIREIRKEKNYTLINILVGLD